MQGQQKELSQGDYFDLGQAAKQYRAHVSGKRLHGRASVERLASGSRSSAEGNPSFTSLLSESSEGMSSRHSHENLVKQVTSWLKSEKSRRSARKAKRKATAAKVASDVEQSLREAKRDSSETHATQERRSSDSSEGSVALDQLAMILERTMSIKSTDSPSRLHRAATHSRKLSTLFKRNSAISSGEDHFDSIDQLVPGCEAVLDNSKTMTYGAGGPDSESTDDLTRVASRRAKKEKEAWATFKYEIVRITHTLKLKGWRRVPLEMSGEISVDRLSGALTNAVYVVSPPKDLPAPAQREDGVPVPKSPPP
jgi:choline kinase